MTGSRTRIRNRIPDTQAKPKFIIRWQGAVIAILNLVMAKDLLEIMDDFKNEDLSEDEKDFKNVLRRAVHEDSLAVVQEDEQQFMISRHKGAVIITLEPDLGLTLLDLLESCGEDLQPAECSLKFELQNAINFKEQYEGRRERQHRS